MFDSSVDQVLRTGAVGCRCDNMTTAGVATELKSTRKFSENFIETDFCARVRRNRRRQAVSSANSLAIFAAIRRVSAALLPSGNRSSDRQRNLNFELNYMRRIQFD
jgi:hypothetical protein